MTLFSSTAHVPATCFSACALTTASSTCGKRSSRHLGGLGEAGGRLYLLVDRSTHCGCNFIGPSRRGAQLLLERLHSKKAHSRKIRMGHRKVVLKKYRHPLIKGPKGPEPALVPTDITDDGCCGTSPRRRRQSAVARLHEAISIPSHGRGVPLPGLPEGDAMRR